MDKGQEMQHLKNEAEALFSEICQSSCIMIWGEGDLDSPLAIIGEAPGAVETEQRRPFVGPSGRFLTEELHTLGVERNQIYVSNIVKCRPTRRKSNIESNRPPMPSEIAFWKDILLRELHILAPKIVLCLGNHAASALIHPIFKMDKERGQWFESQEYKLIATYHPSYVSRFRAKESGKPLEQLRSDLKEAIQAANIK